MPKPDEQKFYKSADSLTSNYPPSYASIHIYSYSDTQLTELSFSITLLIQDDLNQYKLSQLSTSLLF